jgi:Flp pilus assembly protein TadG
MRAKRPISARRRSQRGSAIVESTLCLMGFLFLTFGLMEFSMAVYAYNYVTFAAAEGARYAATHGSSVTAPNAPATLSDIQRVVRAQGVALLRNRITVRGNPLLVPEGEPPADSVWAQENGVYNNDPGSTVTVRVSYEVVPLVRLVLRQPLTVSSTAQMVISH